MLTVPADLLFSRLTGCCCLKYQCKCSYCRPYGPEETAAAFQAFLSLLVWMLLHRICNPSNRYGLLRVLAHRYHQVRLVAGDLDRSPTNALRLGQRVAGAAYLLNTCVLRFSKANSVHVAEASGVHKLWCMQEWPISCSAGGACGNIFGLTVILSYAVTMHASRNLCKHNSS